MILRSGPLREIAIPDRRGGKTLLLIRRYFHRTADDAEGLTFKHWQHSTKKGESLVVNSSELRAVQGHQKNDFILRPINPPMLRQKVARGGKKTAHTAEIEYSSRQKWGIDPEIDHDTRKVCESS